MKYEEVYLNAYRSIAEANRELAWHLDFIARPHQGLERMIQHAAYFAALSMKAAASSRQSELPTPPRAVPRKAFGAQFITYPTRISVQSNGVSSNYLVDSVNFV